MDWKRHIAEMQASVSLEELSGRLSNASREMGFSYFSLVQRSCSGLNLTGVQLSDFPQDWVEKLGERYYYAHDPVLERASNASLPFWWDDQEFVEQQTDKHRAFMAEAAAMGLHNGLSVPLFIPGEPAGLASFAVTGATRPPKDVEPIAMYIGTFGFETGRRLIAAQMPHPDSDEELSRYVITMLGRGRSAAVIAKLANVKLHEIDSIISKAKKHYRVNSTTQIVVHALRNGIVSYLEMLEQQVELPQTELNRLDIRPNSVSGVRPH